MVASQKPTAKAEVKVMAGALPPITESLLSTSPPDHWNCSTPVDPQPQQQPQQQQQQQQQYSTAAAASTLTFVVAEHYMLRELFALYLDATSAEDKLHHMRRILKFLPAHEQREVELLFPLAAQRLGTTPHHRPKTPSVTETPNHAARSLLQYLESHPTPSTMEEWRAHSATGRRLVEAQEQHMDQEELHLLQPLAAALTADELQQLKAKWRDSAAATAAAEADAEAAAKKH